MLNDKSELPAWLFETCTAITFSPSTNAEAGIVGVIVALSLIVLVANWFQAIGPDD